MSRAASQGPAWAGSNRSAKLPANWRGLRRHILSRDHWQCTAVDDGIRCKQPATDVDHVQPGDDHRPANLTSLCHWHHAKKTAAEGNAARRRVSNKRKTEPHPGLAG